MKIFGLITTVFLISALFGSCDIFKKDKLISNDIDSLTTIIDDAANELINTESDSTEIETIVQETEPISEPSQMDEPSTGYNSDRFYMVVGSFLSEKLAQKHAKKMLDMGYQPQVIYSNSLGFYRVSAQSYDNYSIAINDISNFRNNVTPRAWVHVKK